MMATIKTIGLKYRQYLLILFSVVLALMFAGNVHAEGEVAPDGVENPITEDILDEEGENLLVQVDPVDNSPQDVSTLEHEILPTTAGSPSDEVLGEEAISADAIILESELVLESDAEDLIGLITPESENILADPDPYFYVGTKKYSFTFTDCDPDTVGDQACADPIGAALTYIDTNNVLPTNRKLYVEAGSYPGFTIDGSGSPELQQLNGIIGEDGSSLTNITGDINILSNLKGFTLSGFTVDGAVFFDSNSGTLKLSDLVVTNSGGTGIEVVNHAGAVELDKVNTSGNLDEGADLENLDGKYAVKVVNSVFNSNGFGASYARAGLLISSNGATTINGVSASGNQGDGIDVYYFSSLNVINAVLHNNQDLQNDAWWGFGLYTESDQKANVTLENVFANNNHGGIFITTQGNLNAKHIEAIDNDDGNPSDPFVNDHGLYFYSELGSSRVEFAEFSGNGQDGLHIENKGYIYLNSVRANGNWVNGAYLDNLFELVPMEFSGVGNVTITSPKSGTWLESNSFSQNGANGLYILSKKTVSVFNTTANFNTGDGIYIDNNEGTGAVTMSVNTHSLVNEVINNTGFGLHVISSGTVKIYDLEAKSNNENGVDVGTTGNISLKNVMSHNNTELGASLNNSIAPRPKTVIITDSYFNENYSASFGGLLITSKGNITLTGVQAVNNNGYGAHLDNNYGNGKVIVQFSKTSERIGFDGNGGFGLKVESYGAILLNGISADGNGASGLWIENPMSKGSVTIQNTYSAFGANSSFSGNVYAGMYVRTQGGITLMNVHASNNGWTGADLDNCLEGAPGECDGFGSISIKAIKNTPNYFEYNDLFGVLARTKGAILLTNVYASQNGLDGAYIKNQYDGSIGSVKVTVSGAHMQNIFYGNGSNTTYVGDYDAFDELSGLTVRSYGTITAQHVFASSNLNNFGMYLNNVDSSFTRTITIQGGEFSNNGNDGLVATSKGMINLKDINATDNGWSGAYVDNTAGTGNIVLKASKNRYNNFYGNNQDANSPAAGLNAFSNGTISIVQVWANYNAGGAHGINLDNSTASGAKKVSATDIFADDNEGAGLNIYSVGPVTVTGINADGNGTDGLFIETQGFAGKVSVSTSNSHKTNQFNGNGQSGGSIQSDGVVYLQNIDANGNTWWGLYVDNSAGIGTVTLKSTNKTNYLTYNGRNGIFVESKGSVTIFSSKYKLMVDENGTAGGYPGIYVDNKTSPTAGNVTLKNVVSMGGPVSGFYIRSAGSVTTTSIVSIGNAGHGLDIDNTYGTGNVTLNGNNLFQGNGANGVLIISPGAVMLSNLSVLNNGSDGIFVSGHLKDIKLTNATVRGNTNDGLEFHSNGGKIYLTSVVSLSNGGDGTKIAFTAPSIVILKNSAFHNNWNNGIDIDSVDPLYLPTLINATFIGNDVSGGAYDADIYVH